MPEWLHADKGAPERKKEPAATPRKKQDVHSHSHRGGRTREKKDIHSNRGRVSQRLGVRTRRAVDGDAAAGAQKLSHKWLCASPRRIRNLHQRRS